MPTNVLEPASHGVGGPVGSPPRSPSRHDLLLAAIPTLLLVGVLLGHAGVLPVAGGAAVRSGLAAVLVGYALFVDAPSGPSGSSTRLADERTVGDR